MSTIRAAALLAALAVSASICRCAPAGNTQYTTVQIANEEWAPEETFGNTQASLQLGVEANKVNTFHDIGFGYVGAALQHKAPAMIAYEQTSAIAETKGDLVFGTRSSTSGRDGATPLLRVRSDGVVKVHGALQVDSAAVFNQHVSAFYGVDVGELLRVQGAAVFDKTLSVTGDALMGPRVAIGSGGFNVDTTSQLYVNGNIYSTGSSVSPSDARYKHNIDPIVDALALVRQLRPVTFDFRNAQFPHKKFPRNKQPGFIAQELETTLPDLVTTDIAGFKAVAYPLLGVYALAAIKEVDARVETLEARLNALVADLEKVARCTKCE
jgi:hypothetical protein